jgi:hypothetical protein
MVAYDAGIAAPASVLVDMPLFPLAGRGLRSLLSTAIAVYGRLHDLLDNSTVGSGGLVVLNAWGLNTPAEDHPRGSEGNYSDNPIHPFTRVVQGLASAGADVVFAAGNCGPTCPSHLCDWGGTPPIVGANSAREVLTVGAVDVTGDLAGYSAYGPGRLWAAKPDVVAYSQFTGSCARAGPDFGTSAASGVAAGVLAAVRTRHGPQSASSGRLVDLTCRSAGPTHDAGYGWGVLSPPALLAAFAG